MRTSALRLAIRHLNTTLEGLSSELGVTKGAVHQWDMEGRHVPIKHCVKIEQLTDGKVTRKELRPDDWQMIWPELKHDSAN